MDKNETTSVKKVYSSGTSVSTLNSKILADKLTLCEEWSLSTDLKLPNRSTTGLRNFFSLYLNARYTKLDQRILAVSVRPDQSNVMIMLVYKTGSSQTYKNNLMKKVIGDNWINLKISQISGLYEIKIDSKLVYKKTNLTPKKWENVRLVIGNIDGKENNSTVVHYRNFEIKTCKTKGKKQRLKIRS